MKLCSHLSGISQCKCVTVSDLKSHNEIQLFSILGFFSQWILCFLLQPHWLFSFISEWWYWKLPPVSSQSQLQAKWACLGAADSLVFLYEEDGLSVHGLLLMQLSLLLPKGWGEKQVAAVPQLTSTEAECHFCFHLFQHLHFAEHLTLHPSLPILQQIPIKKLSWVWGDKSRQTTAWDEECVGHSGKKCLRRTGNKLQ